jgi:TatD DNase family protein
MLIDGHLHFEKYTDDLEEALHEIEYHQILAVSVSCDIIEYERTLEIAKRSELILPAFGVHPHKAPEFLEKLELVKAIADNALVLGEIGLDHEFITDESQYPAQEELLRVFLESAEEKGSIVILHVAGAEEDTLSILNSYSVSKVIIHDYYGPNSLVEEIIDRGYFFSFDKSYRSEYEDMIDGWAIRQEITTMIPNDLMLTESDGPGRDNWRMPYRALKDVIANLAELRGTTPEDIEATVTANFQRLFKDVEGLYHYSELIESN